MSDKNNHLREDLVELIRVHGWYKTVRALIYLADVQGFPILRRELCVAEEAAYDLLKALEGRK